jgi:D-serine deaminase-like pyridoxal phosphate-dependent protein
VAARRETRYDAAHPADVKEHAMTTSRRGFMGTAAASALALAAPAAGTRRASAHTLADTPILALEDVPTPALILDLDAFEWNVSKMASTLKASGRTFRPHGKTHKCPEVGKALARAGAVGHCAAKLSEAEAFAAGGLTGLLVTTAVIGRQKIARAVSLATRQPDTIFVVDDEQNVRDLNAAAGALRGTAPLRLNLAVDLLIGRTGIEMGAPALALAQLIDSLPHVRFAGLQSYDGGASHTTGFEARKARSHESMSKAVETRRLIEGSGIACPLVTGGSTGTYNIDIGVEGVTEHQPGSFMFMDLDYNRIGGQDGPVYSDFRSALTVLTTVVSKRPGTAIVDGGYKAFATDRPFGPKPADAALADVPYAWAGDEHGRLDLTKAQRDVKVGDRLAFLVPHCDPTVNLYDVMYAVRGSRVEAVWPIAARGMSQ